jgi:uncharacterized glyoxalase superfamily protein PhnB/predicted kinase
MKTNPELVPLLVVRGAARAIDFYVGALGAKVLARYEHGNERRVSHADLTIADTPFSVIEEARAWNSDAPPSLGGSPVVLQLSVVDANAVLASMHDAGATIIFPMQELLGERMARIQDPFGHIWILRQRLEKLSVDETQRRRDELFARLTAEAGPLAAASLTRLEDGNTVEDCPISWQARNGVAGSTPSTAGRGPRKARTHLVIGPVGAGKSTFALQLARKHAAVRLTLDEWMAVLFREDRPDGGVMEWYVERTARCIEQIWSVAKGIVDVGTDVVLEIGLLRRDERERFYRRVSDAGFDLTIHVLDAARDVRRERVEERNCTRGSTFSMVVPPAIFELASDLWEPPDPPECEGREVRFIRTDIG